MGSRTEKNLSEAGQLVKGAMERGLEIRLMGGGAVRVHCPKYAKVHEAMGRELVDIDFVSLGKYRDRVKAYLTEAGYVPQWFDKMPSIEEMKKMKERVLVLERGSLQRHVYYHQEKDITIDIFYDKLEMCHTIDFKNRLTIDFPTVSLADMILCKMQVVQLAEKDVQDMSVLLLEHPIGGTDSETINANYISNILSNDWGFYHTITTNLKAIRDVFLKPDKIGEEGMSVVKTRLSELLDSIEGSPKSLKWKLRAQVGTKKIWYNEVENISA